MTAEHREPAGGEPMQTLDEAVRAMHEHDGRTVSAWVLVIATTKLDPTVPPGISPVAYGGGYSLGPGTSPPTALGLTEGLATALRKVVAAGVVDEE